MATLASIADFGGLDSLRERIDQLWERRAELDDRDPSVQATVLSVIELLDRGRLRVAEVGREDTVVVHEWLKRAIVLLFRVCPMEHTEAGPMLFADRLPPKRGCKDVRVVPGAYARFGSYLAPGTILMPSFVNVGAYVGRDTLVDTWATVGSCAQIGERVHLSGGVGIGGVLEPLQAAPTIIEDNCFVGARSEIVEGVVVEANSVISMGVFIGQSTKIYDRATGDVSYGRIPSGSVVVPGNLPSKDGSYSLYCAVIVKRVDAKTRSKTAINELLRGD